MIDNANWEISSIPPFLLCRRCCCCCSHEIEKKWTLAPLDTTRTTALTSAPYLRTTYRTYILILRINITHFYTVVLRCTSTFFNWPVRPCKAESAKQDACCSYLHFFHTRHTSFCIVYCLEMYCLEMYCPEI